ncbi:hypothetical protein LTR91_020683 [Friedmanniomyces endolithicus]|uniref:Uncharacterized protein n=1 Tax=Friedmanniomyces endolithicus TaxID=329885 RepID=A0AAN6HC00_9PEZI|nr:hypothetical protein LTR94_002945 [Friedmanniomyces endolithicus]KAK0779477.1 hypothetical protein LTR38_014419 [Friedmanniomyces endolithicus]KAK0780023.1 hypothetical protein LTR75_015168 [Friedmanniomyces endolithicus]KAK0790238.1 hypothetical protein LTR59_009338 [Friedmanniomyces endolithicus]KAK0833558.1 hypothetical protein LTR03_014657 [Friedmanniomyces endolithicus]
MQLFTTLAALAFSAALTAATPLIRRAASCPTAFPSSFKVKESSGYFEGSGTKIINDASKSTASYFYINSTNHQGDPATPILSYTAKGVNYGAWVADSAVGTILLRPTTVLGPSSDNTGSCGFAIGLRDLSQSLGGPCGLVFAGMQRAD